MNMSTMTWLIPSKYVVGNSITILGNTPGSKLFGYFISCTCVVLCKHIPFNKK